MAGKHVLAAVGNINLLVILILMVLHGYDNGRTYVHRSAIIAATTAGTPSIMLLALIVGPDG